MIYRNNTNNKNANLDLDSDVESPRIKKPQRKLVAWRAHTKGEEKKERSPPKKVPTVEIFRNTGCFLAYANMLITRKKIIAFALVGTKKT